MNRRSGIRVFAVSLAATFIVSAAACGGSPRLAGSGTAGRARTAHGKGGAALPAATTRQPSAWLPRPASPGQSPVAEVLPDSAPDAATADLARTLFTAAPVVVVASMARTAGRAEPGNPPKPGNPGKTATTVTTAEGRQALKADPVKDATVAARAAHAPVLLASSVTAQLLTTIKALHPRAVLAAGLPASSLSKQLPGVQVTDRATRLPVTGVPAGSARVAILTDGKSDQSGDVGSAVAATAAAAGAAVVSVDGGDPRADPGAITSLARLHPTAVVGVGPEFGTSVRFENRLAVAETGRQLPGGGQVMFPGHRLVALYGHPGTPSLGALGQQDLSASVERARRTAREYRSLSGVPVVPAFEIIATVAEGSPGPNGDYSYETPLSELRPWVRKATDDGLYVVLDLQPGRASLLAQAKHYQSLLRQPNVGLALDPEWKLQSAQRPLQQIGHVNIGEVNSVTGWLAGLTARYRLPQKVLVLHQFRPSMIVGEKRLATGNDDLAIVLHMDGQGSPGDKQATWNGVTGGAPRGVYFGWKNFFVKDTPMISPRATMRRDPAPVMISYQLWRRRHAPSWGRPRLLAADHPDAVSGLPEADDQFVAFDGGENGLAQLKHEQVEVAGRFGACGVGPLRLARDFPGDSGHLRVAAGARVRVDSTPPVTLKVAGLHGVQHGTEREVRILEVDLASADTRRSVFAERGEDVRFGGLEPFAYGAGEFRCFAGELPPRNHGRSLSARRGTVSSITWPRRRRAPPSRRGRARGPRW